MNRFFLGVLAFVCCAASGRTLAAQQSTDGLYALVRQLLLDSLRRGGVRDNMLLVAEDSATSALLRQAHVVAVMAPGPEALICPGSTEEHGRPGAQPVGYVVQMTLAAVADSTRRQLRIAKHCRLRYQGRVRNFGEGAAWELRQKGGQWRIATSFDDWIT